MTTPGKLIVFYGVNNIGKTTQAKILVNNLMQAGVIAEYTKFPKYDLNPSGPLINEYLRKGNQFDITPREYQIMQSQNRTHYQPILEEKLRSGINVIAEDYVGTSLAWGIGTGVAEELLLRLNEHLTKSDMSFLLDGERFSDAIEKGHQHEENDNLTNKVMELHRELAQKYGWITVDANRDKEIVQKEILSMVNNLLKTKLL